MMRATALALLVAVGFSSSPVEAKRKRGNKNKVAFAVFPTLGSPKGGADIILELDRSLGAAVAEAGVNAIVGAALSKRVKLSPRVALERCKGDIGCIAKLGKRLRVEEVVYIRANARSVGGVKAVVLVIGSGRNRVARKATLEMASASDVGSALAGGFEKIFGAAAPASLSGSSQGDAVAMGDDLGGLELEPLPALEAPVAVAKADPEPETALDPEPEPTDTAATDPVIDDGELPLEMALEPDELTEIAATTPGDGATAPPPSTGTASGSTPILTYVGLGLAGVGVLVAGGGGVQHVISKNNYSTAEDRSTNQKKAQKLWLQSEDERVRGNVLLMIGGALAVAGGALFAVSNVFAAAPEPELSVTTDGASASLRFSF